MSNDRNDRQATSDDQWVAGVLGSQQQPAMPSSVTRRIEEALGREQERRALSELSPMTDPEELDELLALQARTSLGTFGPNMPTSLTKQALGMRQD